MGRFYEVILVRKEDVFYVFLWVAIDQGEPCALHMVPPGRSQVHVSWDGSLHDCDFNYALGRTIRKDEGEILSSASGTPAHVRDFDVAMLTTASPPRLSDSLMTCGAMGRISRTIKHWLIRSIRRRSTG